MSPGEARWRASTCMRSTVPMRARPAQGCPKGCASLRKSACATRNGGASGKKFQASGNGVDACPVAVALVPDEGSGCMGMRMRAQKNTCLTHSIEMQRRDAGVPGRGQGDRSRRRAATLARAEKKKNRRRC